MEGAGTNENTLIEIICSKTNKEIKSLVETYESCKYFHNYSTYIINIKSVYQKYL